jgi:hypothetical protein
LRWLIERSPPGFSKLVELLAFMADEDEDEEEEDEVGSRWRKFEASSVDIMGSLSPPHVESIISIFEN